MTSPEAGETRQAPLNRERIVRAALGLLDEVGLEGLSTRRLAGDLGIKSASLYWHFRNKDALLDAMCSAMFDASVPEPKLDDPDFDWAEWLADSARAVRRTALSRRDGARIMARTRPGDEPSRKRIARNASVLGDYGFSHTEALFALQTLRRFAVGSALQEQANLAAGRTNRASVGDDVFEFGLKTITDGLRASVASAR